MRVTFRLWFGPSFLEEKDAAVKLFPPHCKPQFRANCHSASLACVSFCRVQHNMSIVLDTCRKDMFGFQMPSQKYVEEELQYTHLTCSD